MSAPSLAHRIDLVLPQTQCTRCGYPDCRSYAAAIADGQADINQCPPGGAEGVLRLAALTGRPALPLDPVRGSEGPRQLAVIDEAWCIGCTLCLRACPVDSIVGASKRMHTVIDDLCTGCELCVPVCPVDCISLTDVTPGRTGWDAWSPAQAHVSRVRYEAHQQRLDREEVAEGERLQQAALDAGAALVSAAAIGATQAGEPNPAAVDPKRAVIEAALARARARRAGT